MNGVYFLPFFNLLQFLHLSLYNCLRLAINYAPYFVEVRVEVLVRDEPYVEQSQFLCKKFKFCRPLRPIKKAFVDLKKVTRSAEFYRFSADCRADLDFFESPRLLSCYVRVSE